MNAREEAVELVAEADLGADILEIDDATFLGEKLDIGVEIAGFDEFARGDDGRDLRRGAGRRHVHGTGREIEHGRNAAKGLQVRRR